MGFSARWRDWISWLLSTSSSSFLLNGSPGAVVEHRRGLRQGDSLSALLFIIAIDPLHRLLERAAELDLLAPLPSRDIKMRVSLYADDAIIFANPKKEEIDALMHILKDFGDASGLRINPHKSTATPIRCDDTNLPEVLQSFGGQISGFPMRYLGLSITISRLRLVHLQFILDRIKARLAGWKGKLMSIAGRRVLVRCVLSALPTFALTVLKVPKKFFREVDKSRRRFLWAQEEELTGGKCKVNWPTVCSSVDNGGLGIHDLQRFSRALRLRWLWYTWRNPDKPWVGMELPCDDTDKALFNAASTVTIGDGETALFWNSSWTGSATLRVTFPLLFKHSRRKNKTVKAALTGDTWIADLAHGDTTSLLPEFMALRRWLSARGIHLDDASQDSIQWRHEANGTYSTSSAYKIQFQGTTKTGCRKLFWGAWAPGRLKIFAWLLHKNRLWCNDRLQRRGWVNGYFCHLCFRNLESSGHLFWHCTISVTVWSAASLWVGCNSISQALWSSKTRSTDIVSTKIEGARTEFRKGIRSLILREMAAPSGVRSHALKIF